MAEQLGSFMEGIDLSDAKELHTSPTGTEAQLRIVSAELKETEKARFIQVRLEVMGDPLHKDITHPLFLPKPDMDERRINNTKYAMKLFGEAFDINFSLPQNFEDWRGLTAWAILKEEDNDEYGMQNRVRKWAR